jgi:hypothetical protein
MKYLKQHPAVLFSLFIVAYFFLNRYEEVSFLKPYSVHQWRQADCYSLALNYYNNDLPFFQPATHFTEFNGTGKAVSEFPVIYYTVAKLWKIFGLHPFIFRLLNLIILFCGLYCLFRLCNGIFKRPFLSMFITGIVASSPVISFYGNNFLPDVPALALCFCGWYLFYLFYKSGKQKYFYWSALILLLAALIKITALVGIMIPGLLLLLELTGLIRLKPDGGKVFDKPLLQVVTVACVLTIVFAWLQYVKYYNMQNQPGIFLTRIMPYWAADEAKKARVYNEFFKYLIFQVYSWPVLLTWMTLALISVVFVRKNHRVLSIIFFVMLAGFIAFLGTFFQMLDIHDYYLAVWIIMIPVTFVSGFYILNNMKPGILGSKWFAAVLVVLFVYNMYYGAVLTRSKYFQQDAFYNESLTGRGEELRYYEWYHWEYNRTLRACETAGSYLRSVGIQPSDKIISMPDQSPNISLSLLNQPGFSDISCNNPMDEECIQGLIERGAKYLVINDPHIYDQRPYLEKYKLHKVGEYKNIEIFDLSSFKNNQSYAR